MTPLLLAALLSSFPAPCADATICWLAWDEPANTTYVQVLSGTVVCDELPTGPARRPHARTTWWPRDTGACPLNENTDRWYTVRACNDAGCSGESAPIEFLGQQQAWLEATPDGKGCERGTHYGNLKRCP